MSGTQVTRGTSGTQVTKGTSGKMHIKAVAGNSGGQSVVPMVHGCGFNPGSGHIQESVNKSING